MGSWTNFSDTNDNVFDFLGDMFETFDGAPLAATPENLAIAVIELSAPQTWRPKDYIGVVRFLAVRSGFKLPAEILLQAKQYLEEPATYKDYFMTPAWQDTIKQEITDIDALL